MWIDYLLRHRRVLNSRAVILGSEKQLQIRAPKVTKVRVVIASAFIILLGNLNATTVSAQSVSAYTFMSVNKGLPVQWHTCQPISYKISFSGVPAREAVNIRFALNKVTAATGFNFRYEGTTRVIPQSNTWPSVSSAETDLVFAFATQGQGPYFSSVLSGGNKVAFGGPHGTSSEWTSAGVVVDKRIFSKWHLSITQREDLYMHELGHAIGLGHSRVAGNIMFPGYYPTTPKWGAGDLAGLRSLERKKACSG